MDHENQDLTAAAILTKLLTELHNLEEAVTKHDAAKVEEIATGKEELLEQLKLVMHKEPVSLEYLSDLLSKQILKFDDLKARAATEEQLARSSQLIELLLEEIKLKQQLV
jgi:hypothetical protein